MKFFEASIGTLVMRFYLMMAVALIAGFGGLPWLGVLCVPILLSAMLGVTFDFSSSGEQLSLGKTKIAKPVEKEINQAA